MFRRNTAFANHPHEEQTERMGTSATTRLDKSTRADIYITDSIDQRPATATDSGREKRAILELATAMAQRPSEVLPQFVALAIELTGSTSAGLSLLEDQPDDGVFRWRHLHGLLAPFEDAFTPRNDSPCGVTLDQNRPVLARHPELIYDWISEHGIVVPEVLLTPLYIGSDVPLGTLWVVAPTEGYFHSGHARTIAELADFVGAALKMITTEEQLRTALEEQALLTRELDHRLRNLFAMTDGMIRGSARSAETVEDMAAALSGRLHALANAHALAQPTADAIGDENRGTDLADLIATVVRVHDIAPDGRPSRVNLHGPAVPCGDRAINIVALIIHELASNAAKYGALSADPGALDIGWRINGDILTLDWREQGGPPIETAPGRQGFGTMMVSRTVERFLDGSADYSWTGSGLHLRLTASLDKMSR